MKEEQKKRHVLVDGGRPNMLRRFRDIILPSGERITRHDAKKIAKEGQKENGKKESERI